MLVPTLKILFNRDLEKLKQEIMLYENETNIWIIDRSIANSAGNLCLHLVGNLNTYIGAEIGKSGYIRNRELEFSTKNIPRHELIKKIEDTVKVVESSLDMVKEHEMENEYPLLVFAEKTSIGYLMVHLAVHLGYHLGQVNYHRRLLDK